MKSSKLNIILGVLSFYNCELIEGKKIIPGDQEIQSNDAEFLELEDNSSKEQVLAFIDFIKYSKLSQMELLCPSSEDCLDPQEKDLLNYIMDIYKNLTPQERKEYLEKNEKPQDMNSLNIFIRFKTSSLTSIAYILWIYEKFQDSAKFQDIISLIDFFLIIFPYSSYDDFVFLLKILTIMKEISFNKYHNFDLISNAIKFCEEFFNFHKNSRYYDEIMYLYMIFLLVQLTEILNNALDKSLKVETLASSFSSLNNFHNIIEEKLKLIINNCSMEYNNKQRNYIISEVIFLELLNMWNICYFRLLELTVSLDQQDAAEKLSQTWDNHFKSLMELMNKNLHSSPALLSSTNELYTQWVKNFSFIINKKNK